jgi:hypothetical protein
VSWPAATNTPAVSVIDRPGVSTHHRATVVVKARQKAA